MAEPLSSAGVARALEASLREDLARSDELLAGSGPILRHLLLSDGGALFGEEIVARVRGMIDDLARQLAMALAEVAGQADALPQPSQTAELVRAITANPAFLAHFHALALEWHLTARLQATIALDPVLPPLLEARMAEPDAGISAGAMALLAAQARFCQAQRRMEMPLAELPADLFHIALLTLRTCAGDAPEAERLLRGRRDANRTRLHLLGGVLDAMGDDVLRALDISDAGAPLFLSALARGCGQSRESVIMMTCAGQATRFALALAACGCRAEAIVAQMLAVHPDTAMPEGIAALGADEAAALLATAG